MCRDSNAGEPGIFFSNSKELLTNPCQPSFAKVTLASGKEITFGELKIGDVLLSRENKETVVLNKWSTGVKPVYVYGVTGGSFVGTADHKLVCKKAGTEVIEKLPAQFLYENSSTHEVLTMHGYQSLETEVFIGTHEVFDITVSDDTHTYLTNGIYVSNCSEISLHSNQMCNLTTINQTGITNKRDFMNRVYAASLIGTLQASYTDFDYLSPRWKEITDAEALLGVSFTGIADNSGFITAELLSEGAKFAIEVNEKYASKIGINSAYRVTCLKPEGSASCVLSSSSGIHARHAEYYIRRIRMNADDALGVYLKSVMPDLVEADLFSSTGIVVSLPQESPKNSIIRSNESALDLFNRTMFYHDNWINPGHKSGLNKHNVSVTISLRDEEWDILRDKMWENRHRYTGISLLPYNGGNYQQAPFEEIDQQKYDEMIKLVKDVDLSKVIEDDDNTERTETLACVGGLCEIT
jgi:ribonucleoside-diphosphate reductase alpha chain